MKRIIVLITALSTALCSCKYNAEGKNDLLKIDISSFQSKNGWGYEIKVDHKNFIRQEIIPAFPGRHGFASEADALKTARLVVSKIKEMKSPAVTADEIKALGIDAPQIPNRN